MQMQIALPESEGRGALTPGREEKFSDAEFRAYCERIRICVLKGTAEGEIRISPPAGMQSDYQSLEVAAELRAWAKKDGRGKAFGSSACFILPDGSALSPARPGYRMSV